jgi:hypothetical protein
MAKRMNAATAATAGMELQHSIDKIKKSRALLEAGASSITRCLAELDAEDAAKLAKKTNPAQGLLA